jgi:hypothetical protein
LSRGRPSASFDQIWRNPITAAIVLEIARHPRA